MGEEEACLLYAVFYWEPVKMDKNRSNVENVFSTSDDLGNLVPLILLSVNRSVEEGITIIDALGDKRVDQVQDRVNDGPENLTLIKQKKKKKSVEKRTLLIVRFCCSVVEIGVV